MWSLGCQPLLSAEGCPYLTDAEVEQVTGRQMLFELTSLPLPDGPGTICDSGIARVIFLPGGDALSRWDGLMKGAGRAEEARFPLPDLDGAYALHLEPRAENEYPTAIVVVSTDAYLLAVSVRAGEGEAAATAQRGAIELTKLAQQRVR
jgi:hypothetical protein